MKQRTQKYLHAILALVLSLCLITGCSLFPNSAPKADKNTSQETIAKAATENSSDDSASQPDEAALLAAAQKPLTSTRKTCLNRKPPSPFLPFTIHWQTLKVTALPIMTAHLEQLPLKIHERTLKMQNRSKQTLKLWIPVFYPKTSCLPIPFFLPTLILFCPLMD